MDGNTLTIKNLRDFTDTSDMRFMAELSCDGEVKETVTLDVPVIPPRGTSDITVEHSYSGYDRFITVRVMCGGEVVALKQFALEATEQKQPLEICKFDPTVIRNRDCVTVSGEDFKIEIRNGMPCYYEKNKRVYFDEPMHFVTYRAETDNDGIIGLFPRWIKRWEDVRLHKMRLFTRETTVLKEDDAIHIVVSGKLAAEHCFTGFGVVAQYTVSHGGLLRVNYTVRPYGRMPILGGVANNSNEQSYSRLPRFGVCVPMSRDFDRVRWFGRGEQQSYTDSTAAAPVGVYELPIDEMNFEYDVPQETGSRCDTRFVQVKNGGNALTVYGNDCFSFAYHPWTLDDLRAARHRSELVRSRNNYLYIDYRMRALGSMSCGPNPEPEFDFAPHDFFFSFAINGEQTAEPQFFLKDLGEKTHALTEEYTYTEIVTERNEVECKGVPVD